MYLSETSESKEEAGMKNTGRRAAVLLVAFGLVLTGIWGVSSPNGAYAEEVTEEETIQGGGSAVTNQAENLGYSVKLYDGTNGLPTSDANAILSTKDGFIWVGGYSGLIRYDGTSFTRQTEPEGITNANTLYQDGKDRIWVGTNDNGLVAFLKNESWHYDYTNGLVTSSIRSITEDASGNILIGTTQGIYYVDEAMEIHHLDEPLLNNSYIDRLVADAEGTIYGVERGGSIFYIKDLKVQACLKGTDINFGQVNTIFPDPKNPGMVYIGGTAPIVGHGSFDDRFKTIKTIIVTDTTDAINTEDVKDGNETATHDSYKPVNWIDYASDRIWIVRDDVVGWLDEFSGFHTIRNLPMDSNISMMEEDYEGNLWFASTRQGVMKIAANKFYDITERNDLEASVVNATCHHEENLYIGMDNGIQILSKTNTRVTNELTKFVGESRVRCLMEDNDKNLWVSVYSDDKGLVCYTKDGRIVSYTKKEGLPDNQIRSTTLGSDGSVLAATNGGLVIIKDGKIDRVIGKESGINNTVLLSAIEVDGKYYMGTDGDGIYVMDDMTITHLGREDGLTSDVILRIKEDKKRNVVWIITSNSIEYMKDGVIKEVKGFPYNNNYDIYFDSGENAWVLASNGFYVVKAQDMIDKESYEYLLYDIASGLPSMATVNAFSELDEDGMLYVAARSGVFTVNINRYFEKTHDIKLCVPYVEADGVRYYPDEDNQINLPSSADSITVYGFAITFAMQNPKIQYVMDGIDKASNTVFKQDMKPFRYTNISGGQFTFRLSVANTSTGQIQQTTELKISKEKVFYEMWVFRILFAMIGAALIAFFTWLFYRRKMRTLREKQERDRLLVGEIVDAFSKTIDMRDKYTNGHSARVAEYTILLAEELGYDEETVGEYYNIALLHDIGKIGIPEDVLNKQGKLTDEEFRIIKSHSALGYKTLKNISIMPELAIGAKSHHERPDGKGYPEGLKGDEIPRVAQIIAVADTFDAMYSDRPYRKRMNFDKVVSIIKEVSGKQLSEDVVDAFLRLVERGYFRAPDDTGGGTTEDIDNIHKRYDEEAKDKEEVTEEIKEDKE